MNKALAIETKGLIQEDEVELDLDGAWVGEV